VQRRVAARHETEHRAAEQHARDELSEHRRLLEPLGELAEQLRADEDRHQRDEERRDVRR